MIIFPRILQAIIIAQRLQTSRWRLRYTVLAWPSQLLSHWLIYAASLTKSNPQSAELESPKRRNGPIDRVPSVCKYTIQSVDETKQLHSLPHSPVPHLGHITMYSTPHNQYCPCADYASHRTISFHYALYTQGGPKSWAISDCSHLLKSHSNINFF